MSANAVTVIAEAGINHGGKLGVAMEMATQAKLAQADIVKYQTYITEKILPPTIGTFDAIKACELSHSAWKELARHCEDIGIEFLTTPGDVDSLKFAVEELGLKRIKIASNDLSNRRLVVAAYNTGLPLIISTGMSGTHEIADHLFAIENFSLMHCISQYPCSPKIVNLRSIKFLQETYRCRVGYSDHTADPRVVVAAVFAGAELIEMHFKRDVWEKPIDHAVSFTNRELRETICEIREAEVMLGTYGKKGLSNEV